MKKIVVLFLAVLFFGAMNVIANALPVTHSSELDPTGYNGYLWGSSIQEIEEKNPMPMKYSEKDSYRYSKSGDIKTYTSITTPEEEAIYGQMLILFYFDKKGLKEVRLLSLDPKGYNQYMRDFQIKYGAPYFHKGDREIGDWLFPKTAVLARMAHRGEGKVDHIMFTRVRK